MKNPRFIQVLGILAVLAGVFIIAGSAKLYHDSLAHVHRDEQAWHYSVSFVAGILLVAPHSRIFKTRMGPIWLTLSFLLPAAAAYGLAWNVRTLHTQQKDGPMLWVAVAICLVFCGNAECARRAFIRGYAKP